jgi:hypothetical protein
MTLQSRFITPRFLPTLSIGRNDGISDLAAQEALPSVKAAGRTFRIFQLGRHHQAMATKALHLVILSGAG